MSTPYPTQRTPVPASPATTANGAEVQADGLRQALAEFRTGLGKVPGDYQAMSTAEREAAYERLGRAAAHAVEIAEAAVRSLDELAKATQRDPLTDTPNRTLMLDRMETAMVMARRRESRLAVLFLDLDQFKRVNDTRGHACGDEVLKLVARRLQSVVRDSDTVSRFGGDEFVVLLPEIAHPGDAGVIAAKMLDALAEPHEQPKDFSGVRASIGISVFPDDGDHVPALLESADTAMYRAKAMDGSNYQFHSRPGAKHDPARDAVLSAVNTQSLRQANERLVLDVLATEPVDPGSEVMHGRRVRFLAMVAHELRHPLAPIRTVANLIKGAGRDEDELDRLRQVIENQVTHMARLVDDLLDDSGAGGYRFGMAHGPVDVADVLRQVAEDWRPALALKRQSLRLRVPRHGLMVRGDAGRLAQVFTNLIDNATKYTQEGGRIGILARRIGSDIVVRVSDNGMGMPDDIRGCIFDLFARGTQAMAVHKGGMGIGLAVARELVEAHDGKLSAKSRGEGLGSTFDVCLPGLDKASR